MLCFAQHYPMVRVWTLLASDCISLYARGLLTVLRLTLRLSLASAIVSICSTVSVLFASSRVCDDEPVHRLRSLSAHPQDAVLAAEDLRAAVVSLGRVTGRVDVEAVLDVVFREFCIGK